MLRADKRNQGGTVQHCAALVVVVRDEIYRLLGKLILRQLPVEVFQIRSSYSPAEVIHVPLSPIIDADAGLVAQIAPVQPLLDEGLHCGVIAQVRIEVCLDAGDQVQARVVEVIEQADGGVPGPQLERIHLSMSSGPQIPCSTM